MAHFLAQDAGECRGCPLLKEDAGGTPVRLCLKSHDIYPITLADSGVVVHIDEAADLPERFSEFTEAVFEVIQTPGVRLHPRAFLRGEVEDDRGKKRRVSICPHSWPAPSWVSLIVEQILMDTSGMQPRFWYNDLPWLLQPAVYTDCYMIVQEARAIADRWIEEKRERERKSGKG